MTPTELRALLEKATPGPWGHTAHEVEGDSPCGGENCPFEDDHGEGETHGFVIASCDVDYETDRENDAALIVAAVNALPALLDVCEAASAHRAASQALAAYVEEHGDEDYDDPAFLSLCADEEGASLDIGAALSRLGGE